MNGNNQNPVSLIDTMAKLLIDLNFTDEVKEVGYEEGSFHEKPDFEVANDIMRLYNESLYSVAIPEHLRSHREDIEDIFADNFAETVEKKMGGYGVKEANIKEMLNKVKEIESDLQNSFLLEGYLVDVIKKEKGYDDQMMEDLFGYRSTNKESTNKEKVLNYLKTKNLNKESISAFMGNIDIETGGSFDFQQEQIGVQNGAYGLFQFEPNVHLDNYQEYLKENNMKDDYKSQIDYVIDSIYGKEREFLGYGHAKDIREALDSRDISEATISIMEDFLKPGKPHEERRWKSAYESAEENVGPGKVPYTIDNLLDMYYTPQRVKMQKAINDTLRGNR